MSFNLAIMLRESAGAYPDEVFLRHADGTLSYGQADELSRLAASLRSRRLPPGSKVALRGHNITKGYYKQPEAIADAFRPREVKELLYRHPAVLAAAAVGRPDPRLGEEIQAFIVLRRELEQSAEELKSWVKERIAAYTYPHEIHIVGALPKGRPERYISKRSGTRCAQSPRHRQPSRNRMGGSHDYCLTFAPCSDRHRSGPRHRSRGRHAPCGRRMGGGRP